MARPAIDYQALFAATPSPCLVLGPDLVIVDVNRGVPPGDRPYPGGSARAVPLRRLPRQPGGPGRRRGAEPAAPPCTGSCARGSRTRWRCRSTTSPSPDRPGVFEERWWSPINTPVLGPDGQVAVDHPPGGGRDRVRPLPPPPAQPAGRSASAEAMEAELYARARELQRLNEELRQAHARERQVAVTLQEAMLHSPRPGPAPRRRGALPARRRLAERVRRLVRPGRPARATASRSRSATSSATAWRPPPSWACSAAR